MALNKLRQLDQHSLGVTLPKDDLRLEGLLDENGELRDEHHVHVRHTDTGEWQLELVEDIDS
ncbi:hypothetical protein G6M89_10460 [Natronolimnobius sp. AArcel1]|uniref:hypothetical protein n=1 Tax=Natronolimnobius sp. AArcel1 TaxID=1679093 RepID=UPI0013EA3EA7|nr:hypothetical protein [Natronolimnobius sp. AArcel1]NGM69425.1 hypothetical protein [Natronolimnobius sp. AArcel1]